MTEQQTTGKLKELKLYGMARAYETALSTRNSGGLDAGELLAYMVESEWDERQNQKMRRLVKSARFRYQACIADLIYTAERNIDKSTLLRLATCGFITGREAIIITGATGVGKSYIATSLGNEACLKGYKTLYCNTGKLLSTLKMKRVDGSYIREITKLEKTDLLILDDFGLATLDTQNRLDLLEIIEDRHGKSSTIITSQLPVAKWHEVIGDSTIADAILDRLVHTAHRLELKGASLRKKKQAQE